MTFPLPPNEAQRLQTLHAQGLLDMPSDPVFDEITALASYIFQAPIAAFGFIDEHRHQFKSCVGLPVSELPREKSFCSYTILQPEGMVVEDALADLRFSNHPLVRGEPGIRFYAGAPLISHEGHSLGALCVADVRPRSQLAPEQRSALKTLARQLMTQIESRYSTSYLGQALLQRQREEAEQRLHLLQRERELNRLNSLKDRFVAQLAHELRNPLAPILNAVEILRSPEPGDAVEIIERQVRQLARLVEDLLDLARVTQGKIILKKSVIDLTATVRSATRAAASAIAKRRQPFLIELPEEPLWTEADSVRLEQIVCNLLANAAKFTPEEKSIRFALRRDGNEAVLEVDDEGVGITREMQERIFEPFVQIGGDQQIQGGLGLGLPLVRQLVRLHRGTVTVQSEGLGCGSLFTVRLRLCEPPKNDGRNGSAAPVPAAASHHRVLIIEDNPDLGTTLYQLLRRWEHEPAIATSGAEAVPKALNFRPDVILIDIGLPHMDGYAVAQALRTQPELGSARLIAMSGYAEDAERLRATQAGFDDFFVKPLDPPRLRQALER